MTHDMAVCITMLQSYSIATTTGNGKSTSIHSRIYSPACDGKGDLVAAAGSSPHRMRPDEAWPALAGLLVSSRDGLGTGHGRPQRDVALVLSEAALRRRNATVACRAAT